MPKFMEDELKKEYGADSKTPYKVMNSKGYMKGNKETAKGKAAEKKHADDTQKKGAARLTYHPGRQYRRDND